MNMFKISKIYTFDAAHQLTDHKGKCANLHGHTYEVEVWLKGDIRGSEEPSSYGMVMDYADLDDVVKPIIDRLDHSFLISGNEAVYLATMTDLTKLGKATPIGRRTTAENLAVWISGMICQHKFPANIKLVGVIVSETPKTSAEYIEEVNT